MYASSYLIEGGGSFFLFSVEVFYLCRHRSRVAVVVYDFLFSVEVFPRLQCLMQALEKTTSFLFSVEVFLPREPRVVHTFLLHLSILC